MNVTCNDNTKHPGEGDALLQEATSLLEEVLSQSTDLVKAEWDRKEDDQGRISYTLRLSDWSGSVSATFSPDELQSPNHLRIRLYHLWGDLLRVRNYKQLQELGSTGD